MKAEDMLFKKFNDNLMDCQDTGTRWFTMRITPDYIDMFRKMFDEEYLIYYKYDSHFDLWWVTVNV